MKNKPTITYIKDNIETSVTLDFLNQGRILNELLTITTEHEYISTYGISNLSSYQDTIFIIKDDVEFIHFKNFAFGSYIKGIKCSEDALCILENCRFIQNNAYSNTLTFFGGTFELINPTFIKIDELVTIDETDLSISYTADKENDVSEKLKL